MIRLRTCVSVLLALLLLGAGARWPQAAAPAAPDTPGLATALNLSTGLVRDTNGDGIADAVAARIVVPASPTLEDSQAATNIAARLGFETSAFTLPLVLRDNASVPENAVPILVGRKNALLQKLAQSGAVDLKSLAPGQGILAAVPSPSGPGFTIVIAGGDDEGTLAAANELASRLPRLWNMSGISVPGIEDQVATFLRSRGVEAGKPLVTSLVIDSDRRGIAAVHVLLPSGVPARIAKCPARRNYES